MEGLWIRWDISDGQGGGNGEVIYSVLLFSYGERVTRLSPCSECSRTGGAVTGFLQGVALYKRPDAAHDYLSSQPIKLGFSASLHRALSVTRGPSKAVTSAKDRSSSTTTHVYVSRSATGPLGWI